MSKCGTMIVSIKMQRYNDDDKKIIQIHSLREDNFGERLYEYETFHNCVSLSLSPSCMHLLLGVRYNLIISLVLKLTKSKINVLLFFTRKLID